MKSKKFYLGLIFYFVMTTTLNSQNIIPEWKEPKGLVLVYPKDLRSSLTTCYKELIKSVLASTKLSELTLIVRPTAKKEIETFCLSLNTQTKIRFFETDKVQDIWARDFCPIYFSNQTVCKALYNPSYFNKNQISKYADPDEQTGIELANFLNLKVKYFLQSGKDNLILDGGNFIHNGQGIAIVTNRVIADNETLSIDYIREIFKTQLNISDLILVPVEPGDETGHIDGMVRFINETTVMVSSYPSDYTNETKNISEEDYKISKQFLDKIADTLKSKKLSVIRIENSIPIKDTKERIPSAFGNYINFLRIGSTIFLPQYNIIQDNKAIELFKTKFPELTIIKVTTDIKKLSKFGGVLNCISWTYY
ncbi:MAG: agmatine deiminase family protein [Bacteroidales bacterium]|nr:agmatine deiminase family protein [Bacteroidales bacterium]